MPRVPLPFERGIAGPMIQPLALNALKIADVGPVSVATSSIEPKIRKEFIETWIFNDINKYAKV